MCPELWRQFTVGGMGMSAVGAMSASSDTTLVMATGVVVETLVARVVADGTPLRP
jgi:hypothetical protein